MPCWITPSHYYAPSTRFMKHCLLHKPCVVSGLFMSCCQHLALPLFYSGLKPRRLPVPAANKPCPAILFRKGWSALGTHLSYSGLITNALHLNGHFSKPLRSDINTGWPNAPAFDSQTRWCWSFCLTAASASALLIAPFGAQVRYNNLLIASFEAQVRYNKLHSTRNPTRFWLCDIW